VRKGRNITNNKPNKKAADNGFENKAKISDILYLLPLIIAAAIVPLIVHLKIIKLDDVQKSVWMSGDIVADIFSYYKSIIIIIAAVSAVFSLIVKKLKSNLIFRKTYAYIPLAAFAFFIVLSTALSDYKEVALSGFIERFEGAYTLISYIILTVAAINLIEKESHVKIIINTILISSAIIGIIGIIQLCGIDFFNTRIGKILTLPVEHWNTEKGLILKFENNRVFSTLYNPNYVGSYVVLLIPLCAGVFAYRSKISRRILLALLSVILLLCLVGSKSAAGLAGLVFAILLMLILNRKLIVKNIKSLSLICCAVITILFFADQLIGGEVYRNIGEKFINSLTSGKKSVDATYIEDVILEGDTLAIQTVGSTIKMMLETDKAPSFFGEKGKELSVITENNIYKFADREYKDFMFEFKGKNVVKCIVGEKFFYAVLSDGGFNLVGTNGSLIDVLHPEKVGFEYKESSFSGRGFIWSRTIPLLRDTIFVGHGPDTFAIYFPQDDILGKLNAYNSNIIVDKPHNLYLQIAVNTGVISLVAYLALLLIYVITSVKQYFKSNMTRYTEYIGSGIFSGICGYCITGLANDSVVSVAPVFWVLLGLGFSINIMNAEVKKRKDRYR